MCRAQPEGGLLARSWDRRRGDRIERDVRQTDSPVMTNQRAGAESHSAEFTLQFMYPVLGVSDLRSGKYFSARKGASDLALSGSGFGGRWVGERTGHIREQ